MESYSLEARDVVLEVANENASSSEKYVRLVNGVSARFESGKLTAVLGASGSSKTTLISLLAGRVQPGSRTYGKILFRDRPRDPATWLSQVAYLEQDDYLFPHQTVREYIEFAVGCRVDRKMLGDRSVGATVDDVMRQLHIEEIAHMPLACVSGGERKRVMIAIEVAVGADVLVLDEATSGLDSHLAMDLVLRMKKYAAESNKVVIMIVHQPGSGLFELFDNLVFLNKGSAVYCGPVSECDSFLQSKGITRTGFLSKSEFLFELFSRDTMVSEVQEHRSAINEIAEAAYEEGMQRTDGKSLLTKNDFSGNLTVHPRHVALLIKRHIVHDWRAWILLSRLLIDLISIPFLIWAFTLVNMSCAWMLLFGKEYVTDYGFPIVYGESFRRVAERIGALSPNIAMALRCLLYSLIIVVLAMKISTLLDDETFIKRETAKGTYSAASLYMATLILDYGYAMIRCGVILGLMSAIITVEGTTPQIVLLFFGGAFVLTVHGVFISSITSSKSLKLVLLLTMQFFLNVANPKMLGKVTGGIENSPLSYLKHLRYVLVFMPHTFFQGFMESTIYRSVFQPANQTISANYEMVAKNALMITPPKISIKDVLMMPKRFLFASAEDYPDIYLLAGLNVSVTLLLVLSVWRLSARFAPRMRLELSK